MKKKFLRFFIPLDYDKLVVKYRWFRALIISARNDKKIFIPVKKYCKNFHSDFKIFASH